MSVSDATCQLYEKVYSAFDLNSFAFALYKEKGQKDEIPSSRSKTLRSIGLRHGDMLYLSPVNGAVLFPQSSNHVSFFPPLIRNKTSFCFVCSGYVFINNWLVLRKTCLWFQQTNNTPYGEIAAEAVPSTSSQTVQSRTSSSTPLTARVLSTIKEDDVDVQLAKVDGKVERQRDEKL